MYGGDIGRTNVARETLTPPLTMVWEYDASAGFSPYSVTVADSLLFVGNLQGEIHAVDVTTGKSKGVHDFGSAIVGAPVVDANMIYLALAREEESFLAYNLERGEIEWSDKLGAIESSPLLVDQRLCVASSRGKILCVDKLNGSMPWTYTVAQSKKGSMIHSSPASDGNVLVFGCDNGNLYALDIRNGNLKWIAGTSGSILASPSISGGKVFVGSLDKNFYAFDVETGKEVWRCSLGSSIYSSQAVDERHVIVGTVGRMLYCLKKETGEVIWSYRASGAINAAPIISGPVVYAGSIDKHLYAFDTDSGNMLWQYTTEGRIKTMPVIWRQQLFLLAEDHSVFAFKPEHMR
jgi:outer membrane protein assembly factor BamB